MSEAGKPQDLPGHTNDAAPSPETGNEAPFLPYGRQLIEEDDIEAVVETLRGDYLTTGPAVERFERRLAEETGARHAIACSNGTAALHLAALALGLGPGDRVIVPSITFVATANAARYVGADVIFADVNPDTALMEPDHLEDALARAPGKRADAVFPVHMAGQSVDLEPLSSLARDRGLAIVEDAAHAIGTQYGDSAIGGCAYSDATCFSFHPVKTIAMGEGGAITTNSDLLAQEMRDKRSHGLVRDAARLSSKAAATTEDGETKSWIYEMPDIGFNYRASDIHCALGAQQLGKLARFTARRRALVSAYDARLAQLPAALKAHVKSLGRAPGCAPAWHLYVLLIDFAALGTSRARLMRELRGRGVGTQVHYIPVHKQPYYVRRYGELDLPGADKYYERCLTLPLYPSMTESDVERVVNALQASLS